MAVVKCLAFCNKLKLKNLMSFVNSEFSRQEFAPFPFDILNYYMPLKMKFLRESYVALSCNKITGLITLEKDENNKNRLKITQLFLEPDSTEYGELLIDYVVAKFLAQGAQSLYVVVDENDVRLIELLTSACKFRFSARENLYLVKKADMAQLCDDNINYADVMQKSDLEEVVEFYNDCLNSHQRHSFLKEKSILRGNLAVKFKGMNSHQYILRNDKGRIFAYFKISTLNYSDYILDFVILPSYEEYFIDILKFSYKEISKKTFHEWNFFIKLKSCFSNFEKLNCILNMHGFMLHKRSNILTKDLYRPVKADNILYGKQIIFSDITPFPT